MTTSPTHVTITSDVTPKKGSYRPIYDALRRLRPGQWVRVTFPNEDALFNAQRTLLAWGRRNKRRLTTTRDDLDLCVSYSDLVR